MEFSECNYASKEEYELAMKLAEDVRAYCSRHHIPMMFTMAEEQGNNTKYTNFIVTPLEARVNLTDDRISKLNVAFDDGFYIRLKVQDEEARDRRKLVTADCFDVENDGFSDNDGKDVFES